MAKPKANPFKPDETQPANNASTETVQATGETQTIDPPKVEKPETPESNPPPSTEQQQVNMDNEAAPVVPQVASDVVNLMEGETDPALPPAPVLPPAAPIPGTVTNEETEIPGDTRPISKNGKRIGRPPGSKTQSASPSSIISIAANEAKPNYTLMGEVVFDMGTNALAVGLGEEWLPSSPQERTLVSGCLGKYFEAQQVKDIPPGMMLGLVLSVYALPRLSKPSTASKIKIGWLWLKGKFAKKNPFKEAA